MRLLFHTEEIMSAPGGATLTMLFYLKELRRRGHEIHILATSSAVSSLEGIPVHETQHPNSVRDAYAWADVVLIIRRAALQHLREFRRWHAPHGYPCPLFVYFSHNIGQPFRHGYDEDDLDLVVFNAKWVEKETAWQGPSMVIHPPIFEELYKTVPGTAITQINLARKKGGELFWTLARALPEHQFIGVRSADKGQIVPEKAELPSNVELLGYTNDMRSVYSRTRVLLVPSQGWIGNHRWGRSHWTESYGRVGVEAALSGIPVVAHRTPGIEEALGDRALYPGSRAEDWCQVLKRLDDPVFYKERSEIARSVCETIDPRGDIDRLESAIRFQLNNRSRIAIGRPFFETIDVKPPVRFPSLKTPLEPKSAQLTATSPTKKDPPTSAIFRAFCNRLGSLLNVATKWLRLMPLLPSSIGLTALAYLVPKKPGRILVMAPENGRFLDSAKYAYLCLLDAGHDVLFVTYDAALADEYKSSGIRAVSTTRVEGKLAILRATVIVGVAIFPFRKALGHLGARAAKVQLWHGAGLKKFGLNRPSNRKKRTSFYWKVEWALNRMHPVFDILYMPSERMAQERASSFRYKRLLLNGLLRNDAISSSSAFEGRPSLGVDAAAAKSIVQAKTANKKLVLVAPSFRRKNKPLNDKFIKFDFELLDQVAQDFDALIVVKLHPYTAALDLRHLSSTVVYDSLSDIYPYLGLFDVLITDVSSIFSDFLHLQRPVGFYIPDPNRVSKWFGINKSTVSRLPGPVFKKFQEVADWLRLQLYSPEAPKADASNQYHEFTDGQNCARFLKDMEDLLKGAAPPPVPSRHEDVLNSSSAAPHATGNASRETGMHSVPFLGRPAASGDTTTVRERAQRST